MLKRGIKDNRILAKRHKLFLQSFANSKLADSCRLTGGSALAAFYLEHRFSEDLEFFSPEKISALSVRNFLSKLDFIENIRFKKNFDSGNVFTLKLRGGGEMKTAFTYCPFENMCEPVVIDGVPVNGFANIVLSKLYAVAAHPDVKDYVDIYCALKDDPLSLERFIGLSEKKCDIVGIRHILMSRLLDVPDGLESLDLKTKLEKTEIETFFYTAIKQMVRETLFLNRIREARLTSVLRRTAP